ncbi:enoyl-CoA hydratase [Aureococcus anophagefferens]|nr:enoyl-CoA hydratase [Aureococcus anophagefferens]
MLARALRATRRAFSSSSIVTTEITDGVATITLNAPERLNAMTVEMGEAFEAAVGELRDKPPNELRAAILTGAGRAFSAGGDLDWLLERHRDSPTNNAKIMRDFYGRFLSLRTLEVPIVAAINGPAIGAAARRLRLRAAASRRQTPRSASRSSASGCPGHGVDALAAVHRRAPA